MPPDRIIRVDEDWTPTHAEAVAGLLYGPEKALEQVVGLEPRMACPDCGGVCSGIAAAEPQYQIPPVEGPASAVVDGDPPRYLYSLEPCGCRVSQEWAAAWQAERNRRLAGQKPGPIVDMTPEQRKERARALEDRISKLYSLVATAPGSREAAEYLLVVYTDQLVRLHPGAHNKVPKVALSEKVRKWAADRGYHTPLPEYDPFSAAKTKGWPIVFDAVLPPPPDAGAGYAPDYPMPGYLKKKQFAADTADAKASAAPFFHDQPTAGFGVAHKTFECEKAGGKSFDPQTIADDRLRYLVDRLQVDASAAETKAAGVLRRGARSLQFGVLFGRVRALVSQMGVAGLAEWISARAAGHQVSAGIARSAAAGIVAAVEGRLSCNTPFSAAEADFLALLLASAQARPPSVPSPAVGPVAQAGGATREERLEAFYARFLKKSRRAIASDQED